MLVNGALPIRFGIITDIHYAPAEGPGSAAMAACDIDRCVDFWQHAGADFAIQLGDLISREGPEAESDLLVIRAMLARYPMPIRHVVGNHCLAVPLGRFMGIMGLRSPWYSFAAGGVRFIALHGMDVSVLAEPGCEADLARLRRFHEELGMPFYCGALGTKQLEWLEGELGAAEQRGEAVVILSHLPLLEETTDPKHGLLWNHEEAVETLLRHPNVKACISGHYHPGAYAFRGGIHFIVLPGFVTREEHPGSPCCIAELQDDRLRITAEDGSILHDLRFDANPGRC